MGAPVEVRLGGEVYRVVSSAEDADVQRYASVVSAKLAELGPATRSGGAKVFLLVALALARELDEERRRSEAFRLRAGEVLSHISKQVEDALGRFPEDLEP